MHRNLKIALTFLCLSAISYTVKGQEAVEQRPDTSPTEATPYPESSGEAAAAQKPKTEKVAAPQKADLQDSMTAGEFKAAGLDKLSSEELKNLNNWLQGYRQKAETKAAAKATEEVTKKNAAEVRAKMDGLLSRVDGTFTGLTGHTIIKLEDGTVWKQANVEDRYRAQVTDRPPVKVMHTSFGYKMRVVGTGEFYVDPVH